MAPGPPAETTALHIGSQTFEPTRMWPSTRPPPCHTAGASATGENQGTSLGSTADEPMPGGPGVAWVVRQTSPGAWVPGNIPGCTQNASPSGPTPPLHPQLKPSHNLSFHSQQKATSLQWPAKPYLMWPQLLSELSSWVPAPSTGQVIQDTSFFQAKQACSHSTLGSCFALCLTFYSVSVRLSLTFSHVCM